MPEYVPLRDRDNLPDEVRRILSMRRHVANPWTEEDALVVARWRGYEPTEPWPGNVGLPWRGICVLGHQCGPTFANVLAGRPPCGRDGHDKEVGLERKSQPGQSNADRQAAALLRAQEIAQRRGHTIVTMLVKEVPAGRVGFLRKRHLILSYPCGHNNEVRPVTIDNYISRDGGRCFVCNPNRLIPGMNELGTVRPEIASELVDQSLALVQTHASWKKVWWRCSTCGFEWKAAIASRTLLGSGCPSCNRGGGYDPTIAGSLYVVQGTSARTREVLIKVGISNFVEKRLAMHSKQGLDKVLSQFTWSDGAVAPKVERRWVLGVRRGMPTHLKAKKADLEDGYREAVIDTEESRLAIHAFLLEAQATALATLTAKAFDPETFLPRPR